MLEQRRFGNEAVVDSVANTGTDPATSIVFDLPGDALVELHIFDASGRLVRRLMEEDLSAGQHSAVWDGRDEAGRRAPPAVYLGALRAGGRKTGAVELVVAR